MLLYSTPEKAFVYGGCGVPFLSKRAVSLSMRAATLSFRAELLSSGADLLSLKAVSLNSRAVRFPQASGVIPGLFFCPGFPFEGCRMDRMAIFWI